jgi:glycosyltransferase involved in cell wall biosynthesis
MLKKILIISPEFNEEFIRYQPWKQLFELGLRMKQRGIECVIGSNATKSTKINGLDILKLDQKNLRVLTNESKEKIIKLNPDIIFWQGNPLSGMYLKNNNINNIPIILYVSTIHMQWSEIKNLSIREIFQFNLLSFFMAFPPFRNFVKNLNHSNITGIIVPNNSVNDRLIKLGIVEKKIKISPLCFESDLPYSEYNKTDNKPFTICYLGPSPSIRGTNIIFDVIEMFSKNKIPIHLNFLLRTPNPEAEKNFFIKKCLTKQISNFVTIHAGLLNRDQISKELSYSNVAVIPTKFVWNEPPLAILEAMALGKPVITSNVCGLPELIGKNGFTVNPTALSFYECIKKIYENHDLEIEMGHRAKKFVLSLPNWDKMTDWMIQTFESFQGNENEN